MGVSVPIRGLFNLTKGCVRGGNVIEAHTAVSVPIRGLFNLTLSKHERIKQNDTKRFPSPSGDYLI